MSKKSNRISGLASSLRQLGEIQVNDWDFEGFINKDVRDIEFVKSLKRLGSIRVMQWDFKDVMPAVNKLAHQEVDIVNLVKKVADYNVIEWDFRNCLSSQSKPGRGKRSVPVKPCLNAEEMQTLTQRLKGFLEYTLVSLVEEPQYAHVKVRQIAPNVLHFKLVLVKRDVSILIGTGGHTAAAIRNLIKTVAGMSGVSVLLQILSHEGDAVLDDDSSGGD